MVSLAVVVTRAREAYQLPLRQGNSLCRVLLELRHESFKAVAVVPRSSGCNGLGADRPPAAPLVIQSTQRLVLDGQGLWPGRAEM